MSSTSSTSNLEALDVDQKYEVFLNFRGCDTRSGFTSHLYSRLSEANIITYKDDKELPEGGQIGPELLQAINESAIAIPIFSIRYAESEWCLKELVEINNRRRSKKMMVKPIFYHVKPSMVRYQTEKFGDAFASHKQKQRYDNDTIDEWKKVLHDIANLSGWEIPSDQYRDENELVKDVTKKVSRALNKAHVEIPEDLVGLDLHVQKILEMLSLETLNVRIIGIHGMSGIGKTTLSKFVYNEILSKFEGSSFLEDARSKSIKDLKTKLESDILADNTTTANRFGGKRVLIVVDDVDENTQLGYLIGKRGKQEGLALGSRIILTTRNKDVLEQVQVDESYELSQMNDFHSLQLFCKHAFQKDNPKEEFAFLSEQIVKTTGGLPLALEVIGSSLRSKRKKDVWEIKLDKLRNVPHEKVRKKLRTSFDDELDDRQKHIFLDIACFFVGLDRRIVLHFWEERLYPRDAINVLEQKSLIKIRGNLLWMHDQLRDLGREIVREGGISKLEEQTRLWDPQEATEIFEKQREKESIQCIRVEFNEKSHPYFIEEEFAKLSKLRLFWVKRGICFNYPSNFLPKKPLFPPHSESHIFSEVRWLSWHDFPHTYIKTSNFSFLNLTILTLTNSSVTSEWDGWNQIKMATNLKVLNLFGCEKLVETPDFSSQPKLERLILQNCWGLVEIDESIGMLEHLVHLNLRGCGSLRKLPKEMCCMESLTELLIDNTGIFEIPPWCSMVKLEAFDAYDCRRLNCVSLSGLTFIKKLSLTNCQITSIPDSIGELANLLHLDLHGCELLKKLPEAIGGLVSLIQLDIWNSGIEELPNSIGCLESLKLLEMSGTPVRELPATIGMARKLEEIDASFCDDLIGLPMLPESLIVLTLPFKVMAMIPDLSNLTNLRQLKVTTRKLNAWLREWTSLLNPKPSWLRELASVQSPSPCWIGRLSKADDLELAFPTITTLHPDLGALSQLKELTLTECHRLQSIPKLPLNLKTLSVSHCESLERISDLSHLKKLTTLSVRDTPLVELECPPALDYLSLVDCRDLVEIPGRSEYLVYLNIFGCESLVRIPDVLNLETLEDFHITSCPKLCHEDIFHEGPILTDNSLKSESEQNFVSNMLKICGYSPSTSCLGKREAEGKGKEIEEMG